MRGRRTCSASRVLVFVALTLIWPAASSAANDVEELEALFNAEFRRVDARDSETLAASAHDGVVAYTMFSPFAIVGKAAFRQFVGEYFNAHRQATFTAVDPRFRIVGTTAIAWGFFTLTYRTRSGQMQAIHGRYLLTYAKLDEHWRVVAIHLSRL